MRFSTISVLKNTLLKLVVYEIGGSRYPEDPISTKYVENNYINQYRDLILFYKNYVSEQIL